jgi:hypothetical protein
MKSFISLLLFGATVAMAADVSSSPSASVTFHKDIQPILQRNCQNCHRPGQIGPMSLLSYEEARPWAKAIKAAVASRKMPPWHADPNYGHFANDRSLKQADIEKIAKWVDAGAPQGNSKEAPDPIAWPAEGWRIKPDHIIKGVEYKVTQKTGIMPWLYVTVPSGFKEDTWVTSMEMRPGANPAMTHHFCVFFIPHKEGVTYGEFTATTQGEATNGAPFEGCYEKGQEEFDYRPQHAARLIPANSDVIFQMHYAPNGQEAIDVPQLGFTVTNQRPQRQYVFVNVGAGQRINIKPGEADYKAPEQEGELLVDAEIVWMQAHAHYRAKEMTFSYAFPDGRNETALKIHWDPYWQSLYYPTKPIHAPKGTLLHVEGRYDNSANNKFNPDPTAPVKFGEQAADEMLFITYGAIIDGNIDVKNVKLVKPSARADKFYAIADGVSTSR